MTVDGITVVEPNVGLIVGTKVGALIDGWNVDGALVDGFGVGDFDVGCCVGATDHIGPHISLTPPSHTI